MEKRGTVLSDLVEIALLHPRNVRVKVTDIVDLLKPLLIGIGTKEDIVSHAAAHDPGLLRAIGNSAIVRHSYKSNKCE